MPDISLVDLSKYRLNKAAEMLVSDAEGFLKIVSGYLKDIY